MIYPLIIEHHLGELQRIGYTSVKLKCVIETYTGYPSWEGLSVNQQRRLADDLKRHVHLARKWHYCLTGQIT